MSTSTVVLHMRAYEASRTVVTEIFSLVGRKKIDCIVTGTVYQNKEY